MNLTLVLCVQLTPQTKPINIAFIVDEFPRSPILSKLVGSTMRSTSLALLRQATVSPEQASVGPKSMRALAKVCPWDLCIVVAQQSLRGSCVLTCVPPSDGW